MGFADSYLLPLIYEKMPIILFPFRGNMLAFTDFQLSMEMGLG